MYTCTASACALQLANLCSRAEWNKFFCSENFCIAKWKAVRGLFFLFYSSLCYIFENRINNF